MDRSTLNLANSHVPERLESGLPTGTVTFLLTDVEGSTKLWEAGADETAASIARHYALLDAAVALNGGARPVEQGEGDSVVAAFSRASDAVAAALDVQRAFAQEVCPRVGRYASGWRSTPERLACATPGTTSGRRSSGAPGCERSVMAARR